MKIYNIDIFHHFLCFPLHPSLTQYHGIQAESGQQQAHCLVCLSMISFLKHVNKASGKGQLAEGDISQPLADLTHHIQPKSEAVIHTLYYHSSQDKPTQTCYQQTGNCICLEAELLLFVELNHHEQRQRGIWECKRTNWQTQTTTRNSTEKMKNKRVEMFEFDLFGFVYFPFLN